MKLSVCLLPLAFLYGACGGEGDGDHGDAAPNAEQGGDASNTSNTSGGGAPDVDQHQGGGAGTASGSGGSSVTSSAAGGTPGEDPPAGGHGNTGGEAVGGAGGNGTVSPPDGFQPGFCEGTSKFVRNGEREPALIVTATDVALMSCCSTVLILAHGETTNTRVVVRAWQSFEEQEYVVDPETEPSGNRVDAWFPSQAGENWEDQRITGTVHVLGAPDIDDPWRLRACLRVDDPASPVNGSQIFVDTALVPLHGWGQRLGIWPLEDAAMTLEEAAALPLDSLALQRTPILTMGDVGYYDASAHYIEHTFEYEPEVGRFSFLSVSQGPVPFVLQIDDERIYLGAFISATSSFLPQQPFITVGTGVRNGFVIERGAAEEDPRSDPRVLDVLREAGKLLE